MNKAIECEQCGLNYSPSDVFVAKEKDVERYRWLRENPAFETEMALSGLTPDEFDALVDKRRGE